MLNTIQALKSPIEINLLQMAWIQWLYDQDVASQDEIILHRQYYDGEQQTQLTDRQRAYLELDAETEFNLNLCRIVVDAPAERLTITGFETPEDVSDEVKSIGENANGQRGDVEKTSQPTTQDELLWDWWKADDLDKKQGRLHTAAGRDRVAFLLVAWDNDEKRPIFSVEEACAGGVGVKVHYSDEHDNVIEFASKRWIVDRGPDNESGHRRMNLYFPDRIEKYISRDDTERGDWQEFRVEGVEWPEPWIKADNTPLGVPMIPFDNGDVGSGRSDLADAIGPQNAVNKAKIDVLAVADLAGFPMLKLEGGKPPEGMSVGPGNVLYHEGDGKYGKIPGEDLTSVIKLKDSEITDVATVTRTPLSAFQKSALSGTVSGEAQKQEEAPLVARVQKKQTAFGASWENAMKMARTLSNKFDGTTLADLDIVAQWKDAETRNELDHLRALEIKERGGVPRTQIWSEMGYSPTEIADMKESPEYTAYIAGLGMMVTDSDDLGAADGS